MPKSKTKANPLTNLELNRIVRVISIDLDHAIAHYETYVPSGQDAALIGRVNKSDYYAAFNVISDALHRNIIVTLCRIWDTRGENQGDTADLSAVAKAFRDPAVIADLAAASLTVDRAKMTRWLADVDAVRKSDELLAVKTVRHSFIAHRASPNPRIGYVQKARKAREMVYGDERILIEKTIPLVELAGAFIGYSYVAPYADQRRLRREHAGKFWAALGTS